MIGRCMLSGMLARRMRFGLAPWLLLATFGWAATARAAPCEEPAAIRIWWSPEVAAPAQTLRLLAVAEEAVAGARLVLVRDQGGSTPLETVARGGPPWSFAAEVAGGAPAGSRVELR